MLGAGISSGIDVKYSSFENAIVNKILQENKSLNRSEIKLTIKNFNDIRSKLSQKSYKGIKVEINKNLNLIGNFPVKVKAVDQRGINENYYLYVKVRIDKNIVKAKRLIRKGTVLTEDDLMEVKGNAAELPKNVVINKQKIIGKEAKFDIVSGRLILNYMIRETPLVKNKSEILIIAKGSDFEVEVQGIALQDGGIGDEIKVKNLSSNNNIAARVIGKNKVEISVD